MPALGVSEFESKSQYKVPNLFAPANSLELAIKLLCNTFWIALIVFLNILVLPCLKNIGHSWPVKHLRKKKNHSQRGRRRTKARILFSAPSTALPLGAAQRIASDQGNNREKRKTRSNIAI